MVGDDSVLQCLREKDTSGDPEWINSIKNQTNDMTYDTTIFHGRSFVLSDSWNFLSALQPWKLARWEEFDESWS